MELEDAVKNLQTLRRDRATLDEALRLIAQQLEAPIVQREWPAIHEIARQVATEKDPPGGCLSLFEAAIRRLDPNKESIVNLVHSLTSIQSSDATAVLCSLVGEGRIPFNDVQVNLTALSRVHAADKALVENRLSIDTDAAVLKRFAQQAPCSHAARLLLQRGPIVEEVIFGQQNPLKDMADLCLATGVSGWVERTLAKFETQPWCHVQGSPDEDPSLNVARAGYQIYLLWDLWRGATPINGGSPKWPEFPHLVERWLVGHWQRLDSTLTDENLEDTWAGVFEAVEDKFSGHLEKRILGSGNHKGHVSPRYAGEFWLVLAESIIQSRAHGPFPLQLAEDWFLAYLESGPSAPTFSPAVAELLSKPSPENDQRPSWTMLRMLGCIGERVRTEELVAAALSDPEMVWLRLFELDQVQRRDVIQALLESVVDGSGGEALTDALSDLHDSPAVDSWSLTMESILLARIEERAVDPPKPLLEALMLIPRKRSALTLRRIVKERRGRAEAHASLVETRRAIERALEKDERDWESLGARWVRALEILRAG